jgi:hypothetical protein
MAIHFLRNAIESLREAIAAMDKGEPFEALAWLHTAKESIERAEVLIDAKRPAMGPPT